MNLQWERERECDWGEWGREWETDDDDGKEESGGWRKQEAIDGWKEVAIDGGGCREWEMGMGGAGVWLYLLVFFVPP